MADPPRPAADRERRASARTSLTIPKAALGSAALAAAVAGGVHLAVAPSHAIDAVVDGAGLAAVGVAQVVLAMVLAARAADGRGISSRLAATIVAGHLVLMGLWVAAHTTGVPGTLTSGHPEPVGGADGVVGVAQIVLMAAVVAAAWAARPSSPTALSSAGDDAPPAPFWPMVVAPMAGFAVLSGIIPIHEHSHGHADPDELFASVRAGEISYSEALTELASGHGGGRVDDPGPDPTRTALSPIDGARTAVGGHPEAFASVGGVLWIADRDGGDLIRLDGATQTRFAVGGAPRALAVDGDVLWIADVERNAVIRFDSNTNETIGDPISVGSRPSALTPVGDAVWVTNSAEGTLTAIDRRSGEVTATTDRLGYGLSDAVAVDGVLWISATLDRAIIRFDTATGQLIGEPLTAPAGISQLAYGTDSGIVYGAASTDGVVAGWSAAGTLVFGPIRLDAITNPGEGPAGLAIDGSGRLLVASNHDRTIVAVDIDGTVSAPLFFGGDPAPFVSDTDVVLHDGAVYVTDAPIGAIVRLDLKQIGDQR